MNSEDIPPTLIIITIIIAIMVSEYTEYNENIQMAKMGYSQCKENNSILWKKECKQ